MQMEAAVDNLQKHVQNADEKFENLAEKVGNVEKEIFAEDGSTVEVFDLLRSVTEVRNDYQNLRKEILEVQELQKQLSTSLKAQLQIMQGKFNYLKDKIAVNNQAKEATTD